MKHWSASLLLCISILTASAQTTITPYLDTLQGKVLSYSEKQYTVDESKSQSEWFVELDQFMQWDESGSFMDGYSKWNSPPGAEQDLSLQVILSSTPDHTIRVESISADGTDIMLITTTPSLRRNVYMAGTVNEYVNESRFDENGREISYRSFNEANEIEFETETEYDKQGRKIKEVMKDNYDQTTITYTYNELGLLIASKQITAREDWLFKTEYLYDDKNRLVAINQYNFENQLDISSTYSYSVDGRQTTIITYEYNILANREEIITDEQGRIIEKTTFPDGLNPYMKIETTYNPNNAIASTTVTTYWEDGNAEVSKSIFTYDDHGNWIKRETIADYGHFLSERTFKYL